METLDNQAQKLPFKWKGKPGYRIRKPGSPDKLYWKNGKKLSLQEEDEFYDDLQWP